MNQRDEKKIFLAQYSLARALLSETNKPAIEYIKTAREELTKILNQWENFHPSKAKE